MTKHEALKLALEILKAAYVPADLDEQREKAITELEALAQPERTGWPAGLLQDDDRKLSKWLASKPDAKHVVDMAQPEQRLKQVAHVYLLDAKGWPKVGWDDGRGIKVGDKLYIITEST